MKNSSIVEVNPKNEISKIDINNASALLALLHGKNDSICKLFKKEIKVDKAKLKTLNTMIMDKLELHEIQAVSTTIDVSFTNKKTLNFKSWDEFVSYDFNQITYPTRAIYIQWDFFLLLSGYKVPQRHTINVRITSSPQPSDMFRAMLTGGFDGDDEIDFQTCTMICRVDFINNTLAEELINVVGSWNDICENAISERGIFKKWIYNHGSLIANCGEFFTMLSICALIAITIKYGISKEWLTVNNVTMIFVLIFLIPFFELIKTIGEKVGQTTYNKISQIMRIHIFTLSDGDSKKIERLKKASNIKKEIILFMLNVVVSIILSLVFFFME